MVNLTTILLPTPTSQQDSFRSHHGAFSGALSVTSYVPIALFAENLGVQSALLLSICSSSSIPPAVTGCIKDLRRLWNLDAFELFGNFETGKSSVVASVRNGNSFTLVNQGLLELSGIVGVRPPRSLNSASARPTTVNVTFVTPKRDRRTLAASPVFWISHIIPVIQIAMHGTLAVVLSLHGLSIGALLMTCMTLIDALLAILRYATGVVFSLPLDEAGRNIPLTRGSPLDVQVVAAHWNASNIDVVVGYSAQLHALTNIPLRCSRPALAMWAVRALACVLVVQAAALTSLVGVQSEQVWGSVIWLACYLCMLIPPKILATKVPGLLLENQPGTLIKLPPLTFTKRSNAFAFIATLPVDKREGVGWNWVDGFIPLNDRRERWQEQIERSRLLSESEDDGDVSEDTRAVVKEVLGHINSSKYKAALVEYRQDVHLQ